MWYLREVWVWCNVLPSIFKVSISTLVCLNTSHSVNLFNFSFLFFLFCLPNIHHLDLSCRFIFVKLTNQWFCMFEFVVILVQLVHYFFSRSFIAASYSICIHFISVSYVLLNEPTFHYRIRNGPQRFQDGDIVVIHVPVSEETILDRPFYQWPFLLLLSLKSIIQVGWPFPMDLGSFWWVVQVRPKDVPLAIIWRQYWPRQHSNAIILQNSLKCVYNGRFLFKM